MHVIPLQVTRLVTLNLDELQAWDEAGVKYYHLNMQINKVELTEKVTGVLGDSARLKYDENGKAILEAYDKDGMGILDNSVGFYVVDSLLSTAKVSTSNKKGSAYAAGGDLK